MDTTAGGAVEGQTAEATPIPGIDAMNFGYNLLTFDIYEPASATGSQNIFDFSCSKSTSDKKYSIPKEMNYHHMGKVSFEAVCSQIESAYDVQSSFSESVSAHGGFWGCAFSLSSSYQEAQELTGDYQKIQMMTHSTAKLWELNQVDDAPMPLSDNFIEDVKNLSLKYDDESKEAYQNFISDDYGTHFLSRATFGGRTYQTAKMYADKAAKMASSSINMSAEASYALAASVGAKMDKSGSYDTFRSNVDYMSAESWLGGTASTTWDDWIKTVPQDPEIVVMKFAPIYDLLTSKNFPDVDGIKDIQANMMQAYEDYMTKSGKSNPIMPVTSCIYNYDQETVDKWFIVPIARQTWSIQTEGAGNYATFNINSDLRSLFIFLPESLQESAGVNYAKNVYIGDSALTGPPDPVKGTDGTDENWLIQADPMTNGAVSGFKMEGQTVDETSTWQITDPLSSSQQGQVKTGKMVQIVNPDSKQYLQAKPRTNGATLAVTKDAQDATSYWLLLPAPPPAGR